MPFSDTAHTPEPAAQPASPSSAGPPEPRAAARCPACGASLPEGASPPAAGAGPQTGPPFASLGDRALAIALDTLVPLAAFVAAGLWLAPAAGGMTASGFQLEGLPALVVIACALVTALVYQIGLEGIAGTSLGKVVTGIRITTVEGHRIGFRAAAVRNLMRFIDGLAIYLIAALSVLLTRRRQRLGDLVAGTVVVRRDYGRVASILALLVLVALPALSVGALWSRSRAQGATAPPPSEAPAGAASSATTPASAAASAIPATPASPHSVNDGPFGASGFRLAAGQDGPDRPGAIFKPGERVTLLFAVRGQARQESGGGRLRLAYKAIDPEGALMAEDAGSEVEVPARPGDTANLYVTVRLPGFALAGVHRFEVVVTDLVSGRRVAIARPFTVDALPFEASDSLRLRNVRLTDGDEGPPRADRTYPRGGDLWVAFDIVGFTVGEGGAVRISQELEVVAADGTRVLQGHVLDVDERFAYVPRRLPASNHIALGEMPPGQYQARLSFTDRIGGGTWTEAVPFSVRP